MSEAPETAGPTWNELLDLVTRLEGAGYADVDLEMPGLHLRMSTSAPSAPVAPGNRAGRPAGPGSTSGRDHACARARGHDRRDHDRDPGGHRPDARRLLPAPRPRPATRSWPSATTSSPTPPSGSSR